MVSCTCTLSGEKHWMIARVRLKDGAWQKDSHNFEPLMTSGYVAFTNSIYVEE